MKQISASLSRMVGVVFALLLISSAAYAISSVDQGFQAGWFVGDGKNITNLNAANLAGTFPATMSISPVWQIGNKVFGQNTFVIGNTSNFDNGGALALYYQTGRWRFQLLNAKNTYDDIPTINQIYAGDNISIARYSNGSMLISSTGGGSGGGNVTAVTGSGNIYSSEGVTPDISFTGQLPVANGGTGASDAATARTNLGVAVNPYSYLVYTDGTTIYAKNGTTGSISYSGTDVGLIVTNVINELRNNTVPGGTIYFKKGVYYATTSIIMANATVLEGELTGTNADGNYGTVNSGTVIIKNAVFSPMDTLIVYPATISDFTEIKNLRLGIAANTAGGIINIGDNTKFAKIHNNVITGNQYATNYFAIRIETDNGTDMSFGNVIENNFFQFFPEDTIVINDADNFVRNNIIITEGTRGIYIGSGGGATEISGNHLMSSYNANLLVVQDGANYLRIHHNYFDRGDIGVVADGTSHTIMGNTFHMSNVQSLILRASNSTVSNNLFINPNQTGTAVGGAAHGEYALFMDEADIGTIISGNQFINTDPTGYYRGAICISSASSSYAIYGNSIGSFKSGNILSGTSMWQVLD